MKLIETELPGVRVLEPRVHADERGFLFESWSQERYARAGLPERFVQDNVSFSHRGVLRGLHYQHPHGQAKLIGVLDGEVFDVAVDIRVGSPTFGRWYGCHLSRDNARQLFIPAGFAHGFLVTGPHAIVAYKCTEYYHAEAEGTIRWNDENLAIAWPKGLSVQVSDKDRAAATLDRVSEGKLPPFN
jgi:dTDP-4-dehydrorhamnose 3,5-epimerase